MDAQGNDTQHLLANLYTEAEQADLYDIQNLGADVLAELFPTSSEECSAVADILDIALGEMSIAPEDAKDTQVSKACEMSDHVKNWMNPGTQANKENIPAKKHRPDAPSIIPQWHTASLMNYNPTPASELIQPVPRYANPSATRVNPELSVFKPQNGRPRYDSLLPISELDEDQSLSVEYNTTSAGRCKPRPPPLKPQNGGVREDYNTASFARINPGLGPLTRQDGSGGYEALSAVSAMVECPNSDRSVGKPHALNSNDIRDCHSIPTCDTQQTLDTAPTAPKTRRKRSIAPKNITAIGANMLPGHSAVGPDTPQNLSGSLTNTVSRRKRGAALENAEGKRQKTHDDKTIVNSERYWSAAIGNEFDSIHHMAFQIGGIAASLKAVHERAQKLLTSEPDSRRGPEIFALKRELTELVRKHASGSL
ncbi:uncharacterized protein [Eleutherodactylus coqui]|uniref:uncharacterized protein isoform X1 n=1 Tax=Eleutherodactylus coqui TaxID=57060 RepID=UPI0034627172